MNLVLPLNFGERPCDRVLLSRLRAADAQAEWKSYLLWMMLLVWRDFAIARDDRRVVPLDERERRQCDTVLILEEYCGWTGENGRFVQMAVDAGFFQLVPVDDKSAELVLVDFFPANHTAAREINSSKLGGIARSMNIARRVAEMNTGAQIDLFEKADDPVLRQHGKDRVKDALFLIHQVCRILGWNPPASAEWKSNLAAKAIAVLDATSEQERDWACKWFVANRRSQEVPSRMDFVLDRFQEFVAKGRRDFGG